MARRFMTTSANSMGHLRHGSSHGRCTTNDGSTAQDAVDESIARVRTCAALAVLFGLLVAGCVTPATPPPRPSAGSTGPAATGPIEGRFDVGGHELWISCSGRGSPTVVFVAGLGTGSGSWSGVRPTIAESTRACAYDRAGIGQSPADPSGRPVTVGTMADELDRLLTAAGIDDPVVLVGHSYGGMVARLAAYRHPNRVVGLVLVDAASEHELEGEWLRKDVEWFDGSTMVDRPPSGVELAAADDLGGMPLVVLSQGTATGQFAIEWTRFQAELATLSSNTLHVLARDSGHVIQNDAPDLVKAAIEAVLRSVRDGRALPACGEVFRSPIASCLSSPT
jgi:pimeloyl-ACP methyl ester carboxylesterase